MAAERVAPAGAFEDGWRRLLAAALAGLALHLAFPRPGWDVLGWVALAPVLALAATARSPRQAAAEGWIAGACFFVPLLRWLTHTMTTFSTLSWPLAVLVLIGLAGYLALYWAGVAAALQWMVGRLGRRALWLAPALWVAGELGRTHVLAGFPWGLLGYVPFARLEVIQIAAWTGVYGVSALLALVNTALAWVLVARSRAALGAAAGVIAVALVATLGVGRLHLVGGPPAATVPVAVVQGNIDQAVKWSPGQRASTLAIYETLTRQAAPGRRLVVWPEAAVPAYLAFEPAIVSWLARLGAEVDVPILVGAPDAFAEGRVTYYRNSAFLVERGGITRRYDKMQLVPFGEYVPLRDWLFFVRAIAAEIGEFSPGRQRVIFPLAGAPFGTVICYEVIFPDLFRRIVAEGAGFMTTITNDAWFGDSGGPLQHLAMVPLRAVENGVAVARAANTGVSALVLPSGAVGPTLGLGRRGTLALEVPLRRATTVYTRIGDAFAYAASALAAFGLGAAVAAGPRR